MRRMVIACLLVGACARVPAARVPTPAVEEVQVAASIATPPEAPCIRRTEVALPTRVKGARQGSAVALARSGERLLAYVADADSRSVHTLDVDGRRELVRTRVAGAPRQLLVLPDGRVVATLSDGTHLVVLEPAADPTQPLAALCERQLAAEPWGIAATPDDARIVVTSGWGSALTVLDVATFAVQRVVPLARDPRSVLVDDSGVAFVSHLVGAKMSAVDLSEDGDVETIDLAVHKSTPKAQLADMVALRTGSQGYALASITLPDRDAKTGPTRVLAPMVSVDAGEMERRSSVYYGPPFDGVPKEAPMVSVVDAGEGRHQTLGKYLLGASDTAFARECLLPRAAAVRTRSATLLVACFGIDAVLDLDALAADPLRAERRRFDVPPGPEGIAVDEASGRVVVFSQLAGSVTVLSLDDAHARPVTVAVDYHPEPGLAAAARGRQLFYRTDDTRISNDGIACSSCHMDGRDDSITWTTPMGPRQTPMLAGRLAGTQPYGWEGDRPTLADYIANTVTRLGGQGLKQAELEDLSKFLLTVAGPPTGRPGDVVLRGEVLFDDPEQGCAGCHLGATTTDGAAHGVAPDARSSVQSFDTPSLRFIGGTAPYFHDGRYPTLEALLADPSSTMGHTASLPEPDRAALAAYLRSL
jgi:DNA-binding beta-propeller fold protein YncE